MSQEATDEIERVYCRRKLPVVFGAEVFIEQTRERYSNMMILSMVCQYFFATLSLYIEKWTSL